MPKLWQPGGLQKTIAENIKQLRLARGLSQEALAYVCGYHRTYVGMVERGERNISIATLEALAAALEVEPHRLLLSAQAPGPAQDTASK
jgi:transcriptional regulator with XRE-family HTH domain